jgi:hypothetical protein
MPGAWSIRPGATGLPRRFRTWSAQAGIEPGWSRDGSIAKSGPDGISGTSENSRDGLLHRSPLFDENGISFDRECFTIFSPETANGPDVGNSPLKERNIFKRPKKSNMEEC